MIWWYSGLWTTSHSFARSVICFLLSSRLMPIRDHFTPFLAQSTIITWNRHLHVSWELGNIEHEKNLIAVKKQNNLVKKCSVACFWFRRSHDDIWLFINMILSKCDNLPKKYRYQSKINAFYGSLKNLVIYKKVSLFSKTRLFHLYDKYK